MKRMILALFMVGLGAASARADDLRQVADGAFHLWIVRNPGLILKYETLTALPDDGTPQAAAALSTQAKALRVRLERLGPLAPADRLLRDQVARVLDQLRGQADDYWDSFTIDAYGSTLFDTADMFANYPLRTPAERTHYLALVRLMARVAEGQVAKLKGQAERGIPLPRAIAVSGAKAWGDIASAAPEPGVHPFAPDAARLLGVSRAQADAFLAELRKAIADEVAPAAGRLGAALAAAEPTSRVSVGLADVPGWRAAYERRIASEIGPGVTPATLHRIGLSEVARLTAEMAKVRAAAGLPADEAAAAAAIRARPGAVARTPADWQARFDSALACIRPKLPAVFSDLPTTPARAERMDPSLEATVTYGWAITATPERPYTVYQFNGAPGRVMNGAADLIFHELYPGHHWQYETGLLNKGLHPLQTEYFSSLYSEGWAQYATVLAGELGCLNDPLDRLGSLQARRQLAARLVLDTGLNALGWSQARAHAYAVEQAHFPEAEVDSELVRYGARMPAQALGYHYGMLFLLDERARAEAALGARFDLKAWHRAMLTNGDLSAAMIRALTDQVIAEGGAAR